MSFTVKSLRGTITVESDGIREIVVGEVIHYRTEDGLDRLCFVCGRTSPVWTDDQELWQRSVVRCL